ncbi:unnamed protein product [Fusarium langsethiae]|nr:unnamed protein product [Fusarium langsethiae]
MRPIWLGISLIVGTYSKSLPVSRATSQDANKTTTNGFVNTVYFINWGTSENDQYPESLPASQIMNILYAFADVRADGTVYTRNTFADLEKHFDGDSWEETGNNAYGCAKQTYCLEKKH